MNKKRLFSIFLIVFIDLLGFGLILPLLPFYADEYGATPFVVGLLTASYAAAQLAGAPLLGRLSDRFGRRPILLVSAPPMKAITTWNPQLMLSTMPICLSLRPSASI